MAVVARAVVRPLYLCSRSCGLCIGLVISQVFYMDLIQRCGDVELNPGPSASNKKDGPASLDTWMDGTRRGTRRNAGSTSLDRASNAHTSALGLRTPDSPDSRSQGQSQEPTIPSLMDVMNTLKSMNASLNEKMDGVREEVNLLRDQNQKMREEVESLRGEVGDLHRESADLSKRFQDVERSTKDLSSQYADIQEEGKNMREELKVLREEKDGFVKSNSELLARVGHLEQKVDDLEGRSKRNNLLFYGVARDKTETAETCEKEIKQIVKDKLILTENVEFDRVHRLNDKPDSPVIACCSNYKDKVKILKSKRKLKGSNVFIGEDFSFRVREIRRKLSVHLNKARTSGKKAVLVFDHLYIENKKYYLDSHDQLVECK